jgi:hypothetical protein
MSKPSKTKMVTLVGSENKLIGLLCPNNLVLKVSQIINVKKRGGTMKYRNYQLHRRSIGHELL